jgi:hypothetical protein
MKLIVTFCWQQMAQHQLHGRPSKEEPNADDGAEEDKGDDAPPDLLCSNAISSEELIASSSAADDQGFVTVEVLNDLTQH